MARLPKLPELLQRKIYKTGQTRGADDYEIFQNRVSRSSTVLIPHPVWTQHFTPAEWAAKFAKGYIVLISPTDYFGRLKNRAGLTRDGLTLGQNALVFYETRAQWNANNPSTLKWVPAQSRLSPLKGQYVARVSATTATAASKGEKIIRGFNTTANKGAGIRVYEYASKDDIALCRYQLEALFWLCMDSQAVAIANEMTDADATLRKSEILKLCAHNKLLDYALLAETRILNKAGRTICPLCLKELSSQGFFERMEQAAGREVLDLTITQLNLFHIQELKMDNLITGPTMLAGGITTAM